MQEESPPENAGLSEAERDELEIEDLLANMMAAPKIPDSNLDVEESRESRRSRLDEVRKHFAFYGTKEEARTDPEGIRLAGRSIALLVRVKELPILEALDEMVATLGVDQETLIWRALEEFVASHNPKRP